MWMTTLAIVKIVHCKVKWYPLKTTLEVDPVSVTKARVGMVIISFSYEFTPSVTFNWASFRSPAVWFLGRRGSSLWGRTLGRARPFVAVCLSKMGRVPLWGVTYTLSCPLVTWHHSSRELRKWRHSDLPFPFTASWPATSVSWGSILVPL